LWNKILVKKRGGASGGPAVEWEIHFDAGFQAWFDGQGQGVQDAILAHLVLLAERGPQLGRPYVDTVEGSRFPNMKELRVQSKGDPLRCLFAFDPDRAAILLVGGSKRGDKRWYRANVPVADARFQPHLDSRGG